MKQGPVWNFSGVHSCNSLVIMPGRAELNEIFFDFLKKRFELETFDLLTPMKMEQLESDPFLRGITVARNLHGVKHVFLCGSIYETGEEELLLWSELLRKKYGVKVYPIFASFEEILGSKIFYLKIDQTFSRERGVCVLQCMDFRFWRYVYDYVRKKENVPVELICIPGAVQSLNKEEKEAFFLLRNRENTELVVFTHQDCGAYGGSAQFPNTDTERSFHLGEVAKFQEAISQKEIFSHVHLAVSDDGKLLFI